MLNAFLADNEFAKKQEGAIMENMEREPDYNRNNKLVASNRYIRAIHPERMNLNAMKLFRLAITQCRLNDDRFYEYRFNVNELAAVLHVDEKDMYRDIRNMCLYLMQMVLKVGSENPIEDWEFWHIFEKAKYEKKTRTVTILLHKDMTELFLQLKTNFTRIPIANILSMKSKYAIRIYELLCERMMSHYPYGDESAEITLSLDELRQATGTDKKKTYALVSNFKNVVLYPALREIENVANWTIITADIKCGRIISGFKFTIWSAFGYQHSPKSPLRQAEEVKKAAQPKTDHVQMSIFDFDI